MKHGQIIFCDLDGTLCTNTDGEYEKAQPLQKHIEHINMLSDEGHYVVVWTARGRTTGKHWHELTTQQLKDFGVKYHGLTFNKPCFDVVYDDKCRWFPK